MADGSRDNNRIKSLIANSNDSLRTPVDLWADPSTHRLLVNSTITGGSGQQYADGDPRGTATGTLGMVDDGVNVQSMAGDTSGNATIVGNVASAATDSGNPLKIGAVGKTANPTAVTDAQRVNLIADKLGKLVVVGSIRDLKSNQQTTITSSTSETTIVTADATNMLDIYCLVITNTSATVTKVTIKDSTAGTTRFVIEVPATETRGFTLPESAAHKQAAANNNWTATCGTSVASVEITAMFIKNL